MNVIDYRHDLALGGSLPHMRRPETQLRWDVFLKAVEGLPMTEPELAIFREHTGRQVPREGGYPEAVAIVGRQGGKDVTGGDLLGARVVRSLLSGEDVSGTYAALVAQDTRGAIRTTFHYAALPFERVQMLHQHVKSTTADSLTLDNGLVISAYPCRPAAVRGIRNIIVILNELGFYRGSDGNPTDTEMLRAIRPTLASTGGKLIVLSSPYAQTGALWDLHRQHYGRDDSPTLIWQASAPLMNPTLPQDYLDRMRADDPEAYASEVEGQFRAGITTAIDPAALDACTADRRELLPVAGRKYFGGYDASGGRGDAAGASVGHADGQRSIIDAVRAWPAPHDPRAVIVEAAALFRSYGISTILSDRYAGEFPVTLFAQQGIRVEVCPLNRSELYLAMISRILATAVEWPNDVALLRELRGLERRRGFAGHDRLDHRPGGHDDRAVCVASVIYQTSRRPLAHGGEAFRVLFGGGNDGLGAWSPTKDGNRVL